MKKMSLAVAEEAFEETPPRRGGRRSVPTLGSGRRPAERVLTPREKEILRCLSEALTTRAVAERLVISPVTVRNHIQRILQKLGVHSKLAAVVCAYRKKLI